MGDFVSGIPWGEFSWPALLGLVVFLIIRGDIVPRRILEDVKSELDQERKSNREKDATIAILSKAVDELTETGRTSSAVLNALPTAGGEPR